MDEPGLLAGRYRLHDLLGEGGMGSVWRATDETLGRVVAVKRVRVPATTAEEADETRRRMLREARTAAALQHPNVVAVHDALTADGETWLVMEYVPSRSLADVLTARGPLPDHDVAAIGAPVAAALAAAHAAGVVHRDVKPGNVLLVDADRAGPGTSAVRLTDFGISHHTGHADFTATGQITGTPAYFAPETARGLGTDARSDVYALGATLHEARTGHPPYGRSDNVYAMLARIGAGQRPGAGPGPVAAVIEHLTATDPAARPDAATAWRLLHGLTAPGPPPPPTPNRGRSRRTAALVALGLVVALAAVVGATVLGGSRPPVPGRAEAAAPAPQQPITLDPGTADPCGLVAPATLAPFGAVGENAEVNTFKTCQLTIDRPEGEAYLVTALLLPSPPDDPPAGEVVPRGTTSLVRSAAGDGNCDRQILLTDGYRIRVEFIDADDGTLAPCVPADAAADAVLATLAADGGLRARTPPESTSVLAAVDACGLLIDADLAVVPELAGAAPQPRFNDWECAWPSPATGDRISVEVEFYRDFRLDENDGTPVDIGGRQAHYRENGSACRLSIPQRRFSVPVDSSFTGRVELTVVSVYGATPLEQRCAQAVALAGAVVPRLPPAG